MKKVLFSLFDFSGNASKYYKLDNNWEVIQVDLKLGTDILLFDYINAYTAICNKYKGKNLEVGIIAMIPCTDYALSGARYFKEKDSDGRTEKSQKLVAKTKEIIDYFSYKGVLIFWQIENPMSRIHKLNPWMGSPRMKFNPCDFALYNNNSSEDRYNKQTWLWGYFRNMEFKRLEPFEKDSPIWKKYGGCSERTKEKRSITPLGFSKAFYLFNN